LSFNVSSTKAQSDKNASAIFTILRHLRRASRGTNGYIKFTFFLRKRKALSLPQY